METSLDTYHGLFWNPSRERLCENKCTVVYLSSALSLKPLEKVVRLSQATMTEMDCKAADVTPSRSFQGSTPDNA